MQLELINSAELVGSEKPKYLKFKAIPQTQSIEWLLHVASSPNSLALVGARMTIPGIVVRAPDKTSARESGEEASYMKVQLIL